MKPGWQTTEFWTTLSHAIVSLLVVLGVVSKGDLGPLDSAVTSIIVALGVVCANAAVGWKYIHSRTLIKQGEGWTIADVAKEMSAPKETPHDTRDPFLPATRVVP